MRGTVVLEIARRRGAISELFRLAARQAAAKTSAAEPAEEPDQVALAQLESYFWRAERRQPAW